MGDGDGDESERMRRISALSTGVSRRAPRSTPSLITRHFSPSRAFGQRHELLFVRPDVVRAWTNDFSIQALLDDVCGPPRRTC
jgi:hypothetical protein